MWRSGGDCGAIRYRIADDDYPSVNCHCSMCRKLHIAAFLTWLVAPLANFAYTSARQPAAFRSSDGGIRFRWPECGTNVACVNTARPDIVEVAVGSLDAPDSYRPRLDAHEDTWFSWIAHLPGRSKMQ